MERPFSQEELNKYAKQSKKIIYSTNVLKQQNKLIRRELTGIDKENVWAIILNYEIKKGINQEVILGTLRMTGERRRKISEIETLISKQLEQNLDKDSKYTSYKNLEKYIEEEAVPFDLTKEGREIIICQSEEPVEFTRTIFENEQKEIEALYTRKEIEEMDANVQTMHEENIQKREEEDHWKIIREKILKNLSPEEREKFLLGERITEVVQKTEIDSYDNRKRTDIKSKFKRKVATKYLLGIFEHEQGYDDIQSAKIVLLDFYKNMKEKGLASDVISTLEILERKIYDKCKNQNGEIDEKDLEDLQEIQRYTQFFNIVKRGMDWNARLYALKIGKIDFRKLNQIIERFNGKDSELIEYLNLKAEMINETQTDNIKLDESKYPSVKKLYKCILNSDVKEETRNDEEYLVEKVFEQHKSELVRDNKEAIEVYNHYAKIHKRYVCPIPNDVSEITHMEPLGHEENGENR